MATPPAAGPWFRRHPQLAAAVTVATFVAITVVRVAADDAADDAGMLYALPVALAAMAFGRAVGTAASLSAAGLLWAWALGHPEAPFTMLGWGTRVLPILLLGALVGSAADAAESAAEARTALAVADAHRRDAAELHDQILQRLTVAKWRAEASEDAEVADLLGEAMSEAQGLVSALLADTALEERLRARPVPR
jgi:signal transduction histidine kinase